MKLLLKNISVILIAVILLACEKDEDRSVSKIEEQATAINSGPEEQYEAQTITRHMYSPMFTRYGCTIDCSGHEAGYEWAEENDIDDPDDCDGNSDSFIEGCHAYAEEQQAKLGEFDDEEDDYSYRH